MVTVTPAVPVTSANAIEKSIGPSVSPPVIVRDAAQLVPPPVTLVAATRSHPDLALGVSPRGSLALFKAAQALAAVRGRDHVIPDDIKFLVPVTLAHRLIIKPDAELRGRSAQGILRDILENTPLDLGNVS